jgi:hypothetical protein
MISPCKALFSGPKCSSLPSVTFTLKEHNFLLGNKKDSCNQYNIWEFF